ncbi:MAG: 4'-phosphopantetheinyl transferase superfamily protein [Clostridiales Family XIII bacterium]|jgi:4'-phosphopantetheinyl transferase|nr:4'-phosphopantetheinyl transferase superfamily protein [Clostridiales Family XIII bacterium]
MYLYLCAPAARADTERLLTDVFFDYSGRIGLGLSRREAESARRAAGSYGKPYFTDMPDVHFSISHSGRFWACLMTGAAVGLDVEDITARRERDAGREIDAGERYLKIARRYFTDDERRETEDAAARGPHELIARFFFVWTRKEAYVKYTGRGMGAGLGEFSVLDGGLGVFFGEARAHPSLALSYCRAKEMPIKEIISINGV